MKGFFLKSSNNTLISCLFLFASFALMDFFVRISAEKISVITIVFFMNLAVFIWSLAIGAKYGFKLIKAHSFKFQVVRALINIVISYSVFNSFKLLGLSVAYSIIFTSPIINVILGYLFLKERPSRIQLLGVLLGLCGLFIAFRPDIVEFNLGHLYAIIGSIAISCNALVTRKYGQSEPALSFAAYTGAGIVIFYFLPMVKSTNFSELPLYSIPLFLFLGAHYLLNTAIMSSLLKKMKLFAFGSLQYSQLVWGFIYEIIFINFVPNFWLALGSLVIVLGGVLVNGKEIYRKLFKKLRNA